MLRLRSLYPRTSLISARINLLPPPPPRPYFSRLIRGFAKQTSSLDRAGFQTNVSEKAARPRHVEAAAQATIENPNLLPSAAAEEFELEEKNEGKVIERKKKAKKTYSTIRRRSYPGLFAYPAPWSVTDEDD
jgi:hypothetical protein